MTKLFRHDALLLIRRPGPPEPSWMLKGWIELTCWARPGWRAICETVYDVQCEIEAGPQFAVYRAVRRGPAIGDECPVLEVCELAMSPTGQVVSLVTEDDR